MRSCASPKLTAYHIEAAIAGVHAQARYVDETDWGDIASLYETLMGIHPTPVVALNRAVALAQGEGPARGLDEIARIENRERLATYPFFFATVGEFERRLGRSSEAQAAFEAALKLARNPAEAKFLRARAQICATSLDGR